MSIRTRLGAVVCVFAGLTTAAGAAVPAPTNATAPSAASEVAPKPPSAAEAAAPGKAIFLEACQVCHNADPALAAAISVHFPTSKPADLTRPDSWKAAKTDESMAAVVRGYLKKDKFTDDQVKQVVAYIKSLPEETPARPVTAAAAATPANASNTPSTAASTAAASTANAGVGRPKLDTGQAPPKPAGLPREWKNPVPYTKASIAAGRTNYQNYICMNCHSEDLTARDTTQMKGADLTDPSAWKYGRTDGELFNSIWYGAGLDMPTYYNQMTAEKEAWEVVNYIRSMGPNPPAAQ